MPSTADIGHDGEPQGVGCATAAESEIGGRGAGQRHGGDSAAATDRSEVGAHDSLLSPADPAPAKDLDRTVWIRAHRHAGVRADSRVGALEDQPHATVGTDDRAGLVCTRRLQAPLVRREPHNQCACARRLLGRWREPACRAFQDHGVDRLIGRRAVPRGCRGGRGEAKSEERHRHCQQRQLAPRSGASHDSDAGGSRRRPAMS
jgi:hypothetical protein